MLNLIYFDFNFDKNFNNYISIIIQGGLGNQLIQNVDKLDKGACVNNFDDFKKYFLVKIQNKNKDIDFSSIKKLLFTTENNITDTLINKYFIKQ